MRRDTTSHATTSHVASCTLRGVHDHRHTPPRRTLSLFRACDVRGAMPAKPSLMDGYGGNLGRGSRWISSCRSMSAPSTSPRLDGRRYDERVRRPVREAQVRRCTRTEASDLSVPRTLPRTWLPFEGAWLGWGIALHGDGRVVPDRRDAHPGLKFLVGFAEKRALEPQDNDEDDADCRHDQEDTPGESGHANDHSHEQESEQHNDPLCRGCRMGTVCTHLTPIGFTARAAESSLPTPPNVNHASEISACARARRLVAEIDNESPLSPPLTFCSLGWGVARAHRVNVIVAGRVRAIERGREISGFAGGSIAIATASTTSCRSGERSTHA